MYQISSHLVHKHGHYRNVFNFWQIWKKVWGRVITPLWCLKAPSPATKKWIFEFCTKFGFRNHFQTFWPRRLVKSELSLGLSANLLHIPFARTNYFQRSFQIYGPKIWNTLYMFVKLTQYNNLYTCAEIT